MIHSLLRCTLMLFLVGFSFSSSVKATEDNKKASHSQEAKTPDIKKIPSEAEALVAPIAFVQMNQVIHNSQMFLKAAQLIQKKSNEYQEMINQKILTLQKNKTPDAKAREILLLLKHKYTAILNQAYLRLCVEIENIALGLLRGMPYGIILRAEIIAASKNIPDVTEKLQELLDQSTYEPKVEFSLPEEQKIATDRTKEPVSPSSQIIVGAKK